MIVNGVAHDAAAPQSVRQLIVSLGIEPRGIAVAINGEVVRRSSWDDTMVATSDVIEIVTAVAGG